MGSVLVRGLGATYVVLPGSRGPIGQEGPIGCVVCVYGPEAGIPNAHYNYVAQDTYTTAEREKTIEFQSKYVRSLT